MWFLQVASKDEIEKAASEGINKFASAWSEFMHLVITDPISALKSIGTHALALAVKLVIALIIFYIGRWLLRKIKKMMVRVCEKRNIDSSLQIFLNNVITILMVIIIAVIIIMTLGIDMTGLVAILAAMAFAVGMALSGTLSNFAGGVLVLLLKPFRIGDYIEAQGYGGTVKAIQLFNTVLTTPDNKTVILPNGPLSTGNVNNYSRQNTRRVEWILGISYGDDFDKARSVIQTILDSEERIIPNLGKTIEINELAASSVNIVVRVWVRSGDFWDVYYALNRRFYIDLPANGIQFPFNQLDVHLTQIAAPLTENIKS